MNDTLKSNTEGKNSVDPALEKNFAVDGAISGGAKLVWDKRVENTQLSNFQKRIETKYRVKFDSYWDLHKWSIESYGTFWEEIWNFFEVISSKPYEMIYREGKSIVDVEWFPGARLNYAENMLQFKDDNVALICLDEEGNEEKVTYAELNEEVKLYAAALKKHGLKSGDRIACYMPNRKECVFAMLAGASIGALWGGPPPFFGAKAASDIICMMRPKFLFTVENFTDNKLEKNILELLPSVVDGISSIEKVIIITDKENIHSPDISAVEKSCFLPEFLSGGRNPDGSLPDLIFEQLPFNHPLFITFTSGTTGTPKGIIHSAGSFLPVLVDFGLHCNVTRNDVIFTECPVGWIIWNWFVPVLSSGATLMLFNGFPFYLTRHSFWDILDKYKVNYISLYSSVVDKMEKKGIVPRPGSTLNHLKMIAIGTSPVKPQNFEYLLQKVKKDVFITCLYGATEFIGLFSGSDYNTPVHSAEIQVPALGVDLKCFDERGKSVLGKKGEVVIATPTPSSPLMVWNDKSTERLHELYLSKYPGVWSQHDRCWINPITRGLKVIGRSDEVLNPNGALFGPCDIYFAIHDMEEISDSLCVPQYKRNGDHRAVLFVKMAKGKEFTPAFVERVEKRIREEFFYDYVPEVILEAPDIPYNQNNKKMERLVMKIIEENLIPDENNARNPECLDFFCNIPALQNY